MFRIVMMVKMDQIVRFEYVQFIVCTVRLPMRVSLVKQSPIADPGREQKQLGRLEVGRLASQRPPKCVLGG